MERIVKVAFMGIPIQSGNYTHFKYLQRGLPNLQFNIVSLGNIAYVNKLLNDSSYIPLGRDLDRQKNQKELACLLKKFLESSNFDVLIPMNSPIAISIIPFLGSRIKIVQIVNSDTPRVYKYVTAHLKYVDQIICISEKQKNKIKGMVPDIYFTHNVHLIPHGIVPKTLTFQKTERDSVSIGFLGRMHQGHKNIFLLPEILKRLKFEFRFELIGDGDDLDELLGRFEGNNVKYKSWGSIDNTKIGEIIEQWDILLFPSVVEGFGLTIIESMNNGVVPIANKLTGITDYIITDGIDGFIIADNSVQDYVNKIQKLVEDRHLMKTMKLNATETIIKRFDIKQTIELYKSVFDKAKKSIDKPGQMNLSRWLPYKEYKPTIYQRLLKKVSIFK